jgi:hypothetical protein
MKQRGVHPVYHAQYLRIHHPNDDRLFPGRLDFQFGISVNLDSEWKVDQILSHRGHGKHANFEIKWSAGDITWLTYQEAEKLVALQDYFDVLGISDISELKGASGSTWHDDDDDAMILLGCVSPGIDDAFLKPKTYKKGSQKSTTKQNKHTHQPNTTRDSSSTTLNTSPSSFTSSCHHRSRRRIRNCIRDRGKIYTERANCT